ncbi:Na+/H+ antiporter NhaA [Gluconacetobacter johannae DSM 13595]|uniref:Na(+)/H(+) antiporter NhaA n=1 Tax=Gluconacetobacter johannae TaxID=112140 RepID=A0A7W4J686_9PROT|nr:Na+/H+ antiporter NhaA [Gluconacetobacter johannae]MBB2175480.1 Na+/H+ antiporter NhaA [Gluconacetobacter johannae]GBQ89041.1 Na+/H+ antiporter NhaA [Gluconacetobacter johannae DSM 13595]
MDHPIPRRKLPRARTIAERAFAALERFVHVEAVSGIVLLAAAAFALAWANSAMADSYHHLWQLSLAIRLGGLVFDRPLHFWINDVLMTVFFLVVGMEIRREVHEGALKGVRQALLPVAAALGGVLVPALLYLGLNGSGPQRQGWAVPTATDIAFAVGVLALLGKSIPGNIRIFLLALAIIDDIVAVLIIAFFYSSGLQYGGFAVAGLGVVMVLSLHIIGIGSASAYVLPGAVVWAGLLATGVHPTLAGVVLGLMTPVTPMRAGEQTLPPVVRVQAALHPWVAYGVMPLFALANAGVTVAGVDLSRGGPQWVMAGVAIALVAGKFSGIVSVSWLTVRLGLCRLPPGVDWGGVCLIGLLGGIGFTMSIFIAMLAFQDPNLLGAAKLGVLAGSVTAAASGLGWGAIYVRGRRRQA